MSHGIQRTVSGDVVDVFAHRFVVRTATGTVLADLGPDGAKQITVERGDHVDISGEMKPSELKVTRITKAGGPPTTIERGTAPRDDHRNADPAAALRTVETNGFAVIGEPRRKPRHFEILGRDKGGDFIELHVEIDGTLRKSKPVLAGDEKWAKDMWKAD